MNKEEIKSAIATLSDNNISPYDLLLAIDQTEVVPQDIAQDRKVRAEARDGKLTKKGYLKNALEDLQKLDFPGKDQVLVILQSNIGGNQLSGYDGIDTISPFQMLHAGFIAIPLLAGADKFFNLTTDWSKYLAPLVANNSPISAKKLMQVVGGIEMIVGIVTAINPRLGGYIIGTWLALIVGNIIASGKHYDVALRDAALAIAAVAMAKLAPQNMADPTPAA